MRVVPDFGGLFTCGCLLFWCGLLALVIWRRTLFCGGGALTCGICGLLGELGGLILVFVGCLPRLVVLCSCLWFWCLV